MLLVVLLDDAVVELEIPAVVQSAENGVVDAASLDGPCIRRHLQPVLLFICENTMIGV